MEGAHTLGLNKNEPGVLGSRGGVSEVGPKRMTKAHRAHLGAGAVNRGQDGLRNLELL